MRGTSGITIRASKVTVDGNYIGLTPAGAAAGNRNDGVKIMASSRENLIGGTNPVTGINYFNTTDNGDFSVQPVSAWQGLRNYGTSTVQFLLCGTSGSNGLLYIGGLSGGGTNYKVQFPGAATTSVYGPDNGKNGTLRLVGSYTKNGDGPIYNHGFVWDGSVNALPGGGRYRSIDYPGAKYQFTHSTMGDLAVGNADRSPKTGKAPIGSGVAYIYDVSQSKFVANIVYPGSKSTTAYGIWDNGHDKYTICGGYSLIGTNNLKDQSRPLARGLAYLVDYDARSGKFSNWKSYRYRNGKRGRTFITHFEGISSAEPGVYTLSADSAKRGSKKGPLQGSWVSVRRNPDGTFSPAQWVDLNYPGEAAGVTSSNSVFGNNVVGIVAGSSIFSFQASVQIGFQLSNVISGNKGNGVGIYGSKGNIVAQNYIGTNPAGTAAIPNKKNGILLSRALGNLIGGQEAGSNNPPAPSSRSRPFTSFRRRAIPSPATASTASSSRTPQEKHPQRKLHRHRRHRRQSPRQPAGRRRHRKFRKQLPHRLHASPGSLRLLQRCLRQRTRRRPPHQRRQHHRAGELPRHQRKQFPAHPERRRRPERHRFFEKHHRRRRHPARQRDLRQ